jgi:membrane protease YdiL (CAAX protease family)
MRPPPPAWDPSVRITIRRAAAAFGRWIVALVLSGLAVAVISGTPRRDHLLFALAPNVAGLVAYICLILGCVWAAVPTRNVRRCLGLEAPDDWGRALGLAAATIVTALIASALLEPLLHGGRSQGLTPARFPGGAEATAGVIVAIITYTVVGPIAEELFFRGVGYAALRGIAGPGMTALGTGAVFAALHLEPRAFAVLLVLGVLLGLLYEWTGSTMPGMIVHGLNNGLALLVAFFAH